MLDIVLALDIGDARTGIAKSDIEGILISPFKTIETKKIVDELRVFETDYSIAKLIIGLPKNMDGSEGERVDITKRIAQHIQESFPELKIIFEDERLTSRVAEEQLKDQGIKINKSNKHLIDMQAAAILLEQHFGN